ncbi:hypothetical protein PR202_ga13083 [Eleusine coracana subsp. coracana]|uniref:Uncharacterized protein n=1 Tax=Eleusine coracana subsp. coracana TaxID=191504 RepID=A0AAV5CDA9_ELECO|nr:hypothetical protein PR202_ga13083 [Eleusine coracana subsp. coracana]
MLGGFSNTSPPSPPYSVSSKEVDSDGSPFQSDQNPHNLAAGTWMPQGDMAFACCFTFTSGQPQHATATFIREAILVVGCRLRFIMFPSSRGDLLIQFDGPNEQDYIISCSPIKHVGTWLHLQRPEDTDNRYACPPEWLAAISATDFPIEHWSTVGIIVAFRCMGTAVKIDPACLNLKEFSAANGVQCLVAWERACQPKEAGGLGLKQLDTQNQCLLLKLLHRLHHPNGSSWARWARDNVCLATLNGNVQGVHWGTLRALLPTYRRITTVTVGDDRYTHFWDDSWLDGAPLSQAFPAPHSHAACADITVPDAVMDGLDSFLVPRLSVVATQELQALDCLLAEVVLIEDPDQRSSPLETSNHKLSASALYKLATAPTTSCDFYDFVWHNRASASSILWMVPGARKNPLWKHRNEIIFQGKKSSLQRFLLACREDARLWACRLPLHDCAVVESWFSLLQCPPAAEPTDSPSMAQGLRAGLSFLPRPGVRTATPPSAGIVCVRSRRRRLMIVRAGGPPSTNVLILAFVLPLSLFVGTLVTAARVADDLDERFLREMEINQAIMEENEASDDDSGEEDDDDRQYVEGEEEEEDEQPTVEKKEAVVAGAAATRTRNRPIRKV